MVTGTFRWSVVSSLRLNQRQYRLTFYTFLVLIFVLCINFTSAAVERTAGIVNDQCPDTMVHVLEYHSIPNFLSTKLQLSINVMDTKCVLITQCTLDRFDNLEKQALSWNGPMSAAIYIFTDSNAHVATQLAEVDKFVNKLNGNDAYRGQLTMSLLFGHESSPWRWQCNNGEAIGSPLYPINALRNLATAATSLFKSKAEVGESAAEQPPPILFHVDVDFVPSPGLLHWASRDSVVERCNRGDLIVIPALEVWEPNHPALSLQVILDGVAAGRVHAFHAKRFPPGHKPTDTIRWANVSRPLIETAATGDEHLVETYEVEYARDYEPYVLVSSQHFLAYDERFRGYGQNKAIQIKWLSATRNSTFHVLPGHFVAADHHPNTKISDRVMMTSTRSAMMRMYYRACKEMAMGKKPMVSSTNAALLAAAGLRHVYEHV